MVSTKKVGLARIDTIFQKKIGAIIGTRLRDYRKTHFSNSYRGHCTSTRGTQSDKVTQLMKLFVSNVSSYDSTRGAGSNLNWNFNLNSSVKIKEDTYHITVAANVNIKKRLGNEDKCSIVLLVLTQLSDGTSEKSDD